MVIASGAGVMVILRGTLAFCGLDPVSATCSVKLEEPIDVGVPEINPLPLKLKPAGKLPERMLHA